MSTLVWLTLGAIGTFASLAAFLLAFAAERRRPKADRYSRPSVFIRLSGGTSVEIGPVDSGITEKEIELMGHTNPSKLLNM